MPRASLRQSLAPVAALLTGVGLIYLGYGLQATLVPLRATAEGFSRLAIGLLGSSYYLGFVLGCLFAPFLILRAGHIRTFTALVAVVSAVTLAFPLVVLAPVWMVDRLLVGLSFAGILVIVESWLNEQSTRETRGAVMSAYIVITYLAISIGQLGVTLQPLTDYTLFSICAIVLSLSALPVALTRATQPAPIPVVRFRPGRLWRLAPAAFAGVLTSGLMAGSTGALAAVFATEIGFRTTEAAAFTSALVLGGALGQYPFGRASDFSDRRLVLVVALVATAVSSFLLAVTAAAMPDVAVVALGCAVGFTMLPVYSLAAAHAYDRAEPAEMVETSASLLILFGAGSMIGPLVASGAMVLVGPGGLFLTVAVAAATLAAFVTVRLRRREPQEVGRMEFEIYSTAPVGCAIAPELATEAPNGLVTPDDAPGWHDTPVAATGPSDDMQRGLWASGGPMHKLTLVRTGLWAAVLVVGATVAGVTVGRMIAGEPPALASGNVATAIIRAQYQNAGGPFAMTDVNGRAVTEADFAGRPWAIFFGFRNCPDVCPTTMMDAKGWLDALGPDADKLRVVFVTVDPERDTPAALKEYLSAFDARILGLTPGTPEALATIAAAFGVRYEKVDLGAGSYTMNHTSDTLLFDASGRFAGVIPYASTSVRQTPQTAGAAQDAAVAALKALVS